MPTPIWKTPILLVWPRRWLAQPCPALIDVMTSRMELVMPPHIEAAPVFCMALYCAKAVLAGYAGDVWELVTENL